MTDKQLIPHPIAEAIDAGIPAAKAFRVYSDTSIPELAAASHVDADRICRIEAGSAVTRSEADAIGTALHIPPHLI